MALARKKPRKEQIGREREGGDKVVRSHCRRHHRLVFCLAPSSPSEPHIQGKYHFCEDRFCECMTVLLGLRREPFPNAHVQHCGLSLSRINEDHKFFFLGATFFLSSSSSEKEISIRSEMRRRRRWRVHSLQGPFTLSIGSSTALAAL